MTTANLRYTNDLPVEQQMPAEMIGKSILEKHGKSDANEAVLHELRVRHALLHQENYHHSYPPGGMSDVSNRNGAGESSGEELVASRKRSTRPSPDTPALATRARPRRASRR